MANITDARLRELQFLAMVERRGRHDIENTFEMDQVLRGMIATLIHEGCLNGVGLQSLSYQHDFEAALKDLKHRIEYESWSSLIALLSGQHVSLRLAHKGLVRLSELRQALKTGRDREPFGILYSQRHILPDLIIALASSANTAPLSVAYLDANGFKAINDSLGHAAGDEALRTYLEVVASLTEGRAEGYRAGGDEVVVVMPNTPTELAHTAMRAVANQLHKAKMPSALSLSVSCGIATTTDANADAAEFLRKADEEQKRAKARSRVDPPRPSVIAVESKELEVLPVK
jgi:diguanylate cyclase (GGDEF)-like protein